MRSEKTYLVNSISDMLSNASFLYFVSYKGLDVSEFSEFRDRLAEHDAGCHVLKNRLIKKAAEASKIDKIAEMDLQGDTAMIFGTSDAGAIAKVIEDFFKKHEQVSAKCGYLDGELLTTADVKNIASLPSKEVLQSQLIGVIQAPARNLASVLNNKASSILNVLNAYKNKLENE